MVATVERFHCTFSQLYITLVFICILGSKGQHQSPVHRRSTDYQDSPAKKQLNFYDGAGDVLAPMDIEGVSLSSSKQIKDKTGEMSVDENQSGHTHQGRDSIDELTKSDSTKHRNIHVDVTQPPVLMSEPNRRGGGLGEVPKKLVPSASTERIMDILRERGLDDGRGVQSAGERKVHLSESLEEVDEDTSSYASDGDEVVAYPKDHVSSSTPAASKTEGQHHHQRGSRLDGLLSPSQIFSVGSSPVHGSSQELYRRSSLSSLVSLPEGTFLGEARHKDGSLMSIVFQVQVNSERAKKKEREREREREREVLFVEREREIERNLDQV